MLHLWNRGVLEVGLETIDSTGLPHQSPDELLDRFLPDLELGSCHRNKCVPLLAAGVWN
jgi:hypothetical protein